MNVSLTTTNFHSGHNVFNLTIESAHVTEEIKTVSRNKDSHRYTVTGNLQYVYIFITFIIDLRILCTDNALLLVLLYHYVG